MLCCPPATAAAAWRAFLALPGVKGLGLGVAAAGRFREPLGNLADAASPAACASPAPAFLPSPPAASGGHALMHA